MLKRILVLACACATVSQICAMVSSAQGLARKIVSPAVSKVQPLELGIGPVRPGKPDKQSFDTLMNALENTPLTASQRGEILDRLEITVPAHYTGIIPRDKAWGQYEAANSKGTYKYYQLDNVAKTLEQYAKTNADEALKRIKESASQATDQRLQSMRQSIEERINPGNGPMAEFGQ
jgi:hypothetical protein